jgi:hypothetical protein
MKGKIFDLHYDRAVVKSLLENQICIFKETAFNKSHRQFALRKIKKYRKQLRRLSWQIFCTWFSLHVYNRFLALRLLTIWLLCVGVVGGIVWLMVR